MGGRAGARCGPRVQGGVLSGGGKPVGSLAQVERSNRAWNSQAARSQAMSVNDSVGAVAGVLAPSRGRPQRAVVLAWRCPTSRSSGRAEKCRWSMLALRRRAA
jgi:hypothetical protein